MPVSVSFGHRLTTVSPTRTVAYCSNRDAVSDVDSREHALDGGPGLSVVRGTFGGHTCTWAYPDWSAVDVLNILNVIRKRTLAYDSGYQYCSN